MENNKSQTGIQKAIAIKKAKEMAKEVEEAVMKARVYNAIKK